MKSKNEGQATRQEPISQIAHFWTDSRGIRRNRQLTRQLNLLEIEILDHGYFVGDQRWNQFDVMSPFGRIYYMIDDAGWLETEAGRIDLTPGSMYLIPPYTRVNLRTAERIEKFYFHFTLKYAGSDVLEGIHRCFELPLDHVLLHNLLRAWKGGGLPDLSQRMVLASTYQDINGYIERNLSASLSGRAICTSLGYAYETMRRSFRRDNGTTFNQYIKGRLIQEASMQLLLTDRTIQQIASGLGFADEFYFSRLFKQKMEYSPREYRRINAVLRSTN